MREHLATAFVKKAHPPVRSARSRRGLRSMSTLIGVGPGLRELLRTPYRRSSQKAPLANFRGCEGTLLDHRPRSARHGSVVQATGCFQTHASVLSAGQKNARRSKENCIQGPVTQRIMIGAGKERGRDQTRILSVK